MNPVLILSVLVLTLPLPRVHSTSGRANPRLGTWKLNVAKSKYDGAVRATSETRTYSAVSDDTITVTGHAMLADGTIQTTSYAAKYDGKPYPYKGVIGDMIKVKVVDAYETYVTVTLSGKVVQTARSRVSIDGRTLTLVTTGTDAAGKAFSSTRVYDKQ
jgi:hypothetical protein